MRRTTVRALGELLPLASGDMKILVIEQIIKSGSDPEWYVRESAAHTLPQLKNSFTNIKITKDAVDLLLKLSKDSDWYVSESAIRGLKNMDGVIPENRKKDVDEILKIRR